jgi:fructose-1,6-bisphosphatase/inositol monophosphatase family enzyme
MHQPYLCERFTGDGHSARLRGPSGERTLRSRRCGDLSQAILATTDPRLFAAGEEAERFRAVEARVRLSRYGADCYAYCMLAAGQIDLVIEAGLKPYDICALIPIIEGAGGKVTTWDGGSAAGGGRILAAGDPRLHEAALRMLNP